MPSPWSDLDRPPLSAARLRRVVTDSGPWREVVVTNETESTNADLAAAARAGDAGGRVLVAESQSAGRGRLDRTWLAPPRTSVLLSVLLRPPVAAAAWTLLPLLTGVAVVEAVRGVCGLDARLKWPNDVLVDERKLGGILVERVESAVVIGVGINVSTRADELATGTATSVALGGGIADREPLTMEVVRALGRRYLAWCSADGASEAVLPAYREICATIGRTVRVELPGGGVVNGTAESVDDTGRLVVRTGDGTRTAYSAGDVVHATVAG